jgi:3-oxoacyl-[acyl-carrier-protein] synthase II
MGAVSPNGIGNAAFGAAILSGKNGVKKITRFDTSELEVKIAGEIQDFNELDWMDPMERKHVSRTVPLAFAASTEALADAGIDPGRLSLEEKREIGVALGSGGGAQDFSELQYHLYYTGKTRQVSLYCIPSGTMGTLASEISMRFGFRGLSHVITTGCTSSTDALAYALRQVQLGVQPLMLAGGADAPLAFGIVKGFTLMKIMTESWNDQPERASRPFNLDRDGFVVAEGAWMFVVEDYEHARARGAKIHAEIAGYGSTCEAFHRVRIADGGEEPARAIQLAMKEAGIGPENVQYVNLHGTATQLNDRIETSALKLAFNGHAYKVPMSSLKSQIGHPQGACGAAGVAATIIAMRAEQLPPTTNLEKPDPQCDLDYIPETGRKAAIEHAVCNCIAFGSKNSALVLRRL